MSDPIWKKVAELTEGYHPQFNAGAAYEVVKEAWRMGFDVVKAPAGSDLYNVAMQEIGVSMGNAVGSLGGQNGLGNAFNPWVRPSS